MINLLKLNSVVSKNMQRKRLSMPISFEKPALNTLTANLFNECEKPNSNIENVKLCLRKGANPYAQDHLGQTALHICYKHDKPNNEIIKLFLKLKKYRKLGLKDNHGCTILHLACRNTNSNLELIKLQIDLGANVNEVNDEGDDCLQFALQSEYPSMDLIKLLLSKGLDPASTNDYNKSALYHACFHKHLNIEVIKLFTTYKIDFYSNFELINLLINRKIEIIFTEYTKNAHLSDYTGQVLIKIAAYLKARTDFKEFENACRYRWGDFEQKFSVIEAFLANYPLKTPQIIDCLSARLLGECESEQPNLERIQFLLFHGADINIRINGCTPLDEICLVIDKFHKRVNSLNNAADLELVEFFLQEGANPNHRIYNLDWTILSYACEMDQPNLKLVNLLLQYSADPNVQGGILGDTPLHILGKQKKANVALLDLLLKYGADYSKNNKEGDNGKPASRYLYEHPEYVEHIQQKQKKIVATIYGLRKRKECLFFQFPMPICDVTLKEAHIDVAALKK